MNECKRINLLMCEVDRVFHDAAQALGLPDSVMQILYTICNLGSPCPIGDIIRTTGISKQTINSSLRKLEAGGYIYLQAADGKKKLVCLTESGKALTRSTAGRIMDLENQIYASWTKEELEQYLDLTQRYLTALKTMTKELSRE